MIGGPKLARILEVLTRKTCPFDKILAKKKFFCDFTPKWPKIHVQKRNKTWNSWKKLIGGLKLARILEVLTWKTRKFDKIFAEKKKFAILLRNDPKFMYKNAIKSQNFKLFDTGREFFKGNQVIFRDFRNFKQILQTFCQRAKQF